MVREPLYFVGRLGEYPKVRILIQGMSPAKGNWESLGAFHLMSYGETKEEVFKRIWRSMKEWDERPYLPRKRTFLDRVWGFIKEHKIFNK